MFVIKQSATFKAPVTVVVPGENGGTTKQTFTGIFSRLSLEEVANLQKDVDNGLSDPDFARRVLVGWGDDVKFEKDGEAVEFCSSNLDMLLSVVNAAASIITAWSNCMAGGASRKN